MARSHLSNSKVKQPFIWRSLHGIEAGHSSEYQQDGKTDAPTPTAAFRTGTIGHASKRPGLLLANAALPVVAFKRMLHLAPVAMQLLCQGNALVQNRPTHCTDIISNSLTCYALLSAPPELDGLLPRLMHQPHALILHCTLVHYTILSWCLATERPVTNAQNVIAVKREWWGLNMKGVTMYSIQSPA